MVLETLKLIEQKMIVTAKRKPQKVMSQTF
jgi:hypothetical protein